MKLTPTTAGVAILVMELVVFFTVTAFMTYFLSHAAAVTPAPGEAPPDAFPVIAYEGNRERPEAKGYRVVTWAEWQASADKRAGASLLLPERSRDVGMGDKGRATFTAEDAPGERQSIELKWIRDSTEQHVRYVADAQAIEPRYYREVGTRTFLMGALAGFGVGLLVGRAMRRRYLPRRSFAPPPAP